MANDQLVKALANKYGWTQKSIRDAISASQAEVTTEDEAILCMIRYAGPTIKQRNYQIGAQKRVNDQKKQAIENLVEQLTNVQNFYATQLVPNLKATINAQAEYIKDLLKQYGKNQGGGNG